MKMYVFDGWVGGWVIAPNLDDARVMAEAAALLEWGEASCGEIRPAPRVLDEKAVRDRNFPDVYWDYHRWKVQD